MWKEAFGDEDDMARVPQGCYADEESPYSSRRVSTISNDSFDASSYVHVDSKLKTKMPESLLDMNDTDKEISNHFERLPDNANNNDSKTKNGKRVIRKRMSISQFRASTRVKRNENNSNNNSNSSDKVPSADGKETGTTDSNGNLSNSNSTKKEKQSKDVLSAKIQHLLFEMKRLRRLDRDILRKFLIINDSIEEQKWMIEEKQEAIKQNLSEEGEEDAVEIVQSFAFPEERDDDEESIQSVLSRQNSGCGVYEDDLTVPISQNDLIKEQDEDEDVAPFNHPASTESEMTSSESVLSISEASSTLSSTTSVSTSQKSNSPMTSNLSGSSSACSSADSNDVAHESNNSTARQQYLNENDDIESYCRMNGSSGASRSGSYTYMARSHSINDTDRTYHYSTYSDVPLDNGYGDKRNSFSVQTKSTGHEYASRKDLVNRSYNGPYAHQNMYGRSAYSQSRPRSASAAYNDVHDIRNRVQRISVRPDGSHELAVSALGALRRPHSATDKNSAVYRLLQHPLQQKHARMNIRRHHSSTDNSSPNNYQNEQPSNRLRHNWSFVPIAEQEPDVMYDNGRLISEDSDISSKQDRREYENLIDLSKQQQQSSRRVAAHFRQCPTPRRKASAAGSAGSLTSTSSRTSSSSLASSGSSTSLHSPTKFMTNEADRHHLQSDSRNEQSVWVPRKVSPQDNEYIAIPYNKSFPAPFSVSKYHDARRGGAHNLPGPEYSSRPSTKRVVPSYYQTPRDNVPIVSYKPGKTSSKEAVYNWIQTQDDITYL